MSAWAIRSARGPNGEIIRFQERPKPGHPGVLERIYEDPPERFSAAGGTMELLRPGERPRFLRPTTAFVSSSQKPKVHMTRGAFGDLEDCIRHSGSGLRETAGALFGSVIDATLTIREATLAVVEQQARSCKIDKPTIERQAERHHRSDAMVFLGTWHTEPGAGDERPSRADLEHWISWTRVAEVPWLIGMTVRKPNHYHLGWRGVMTRAHVFSRTASGIDCAAVVDLKENSWTL